MAYVEDEKKIVRRLPGEDEDGSSEDEEERSVLQAKKIPPYPAILNMKKSCISNNYCISPTSSTNSYNFDKETCNDIITVNPPPLSTKQKISQRSLESSFLSEERQKLEERSWCSGTK